MTGNVVGELIAATVLLLVGAGNVVLTLYMRPATDVAKNLYERKVIGARRLILILSTAAIIAVAAYAKPMFTLPPWAQGMFAAQMLAVLLALVFVGKIRQLTIWFSQDGRPRMSLASMPLWLTVAVAAVLIDSLEFPRTLDAVMAWWQFRIFDNPHIPEGANAGGGFVHQLYYGEEHVVLGVFTPVATTMLLGAMAIWAKLYGRRILAWVPFCGFAASLLLATTVALVTHQTIHAAPIMFVGTAIPTVGVALATPYWPLLRRWNQNWNRDLDYDV